MTTPANYATEDLVINNGGKKKRSILLIVIALVVVLAIGEEWSGFAKETQASHLVFLDESGVNLNMVRRYGRGKGGRRVVEDLRTHHIQAVGELPHMRERRSFICLPTVQTSIQLKSFGLR